MLENGHRPLVTSISEVCILLLSRLSLGEIKRVQAILKEYFQEDQIEGREALYAFLDRVCYEGLTRSEWLEALSCAVADWCKAHGASFHPYKTAGDYVKYRSKQFLA